METSILNMTPEAYRQRLSRIRRKMADFLTAYCGEYGSGTCRCANRLNYAIQSRRLNPQVLDYTSAKEIDPETTVSFKNAMEDIDGLASYFAFCRKMCIRDRCNNTPAVGIPIPPPPQSAW